MNNIVIRKAKNDYVCQTCGHLIKKDTEYLDRVILDHGKCVQHSRYHDECPKEHALITLLNKAIANGCGYPIYNNKGFKFWLIGLVFQGSEAQAVLKDWDDEEKIIYVPKDVFDKEYFYD